MTQYEEIKEYIRQHPGTTRRMLRREMSHITHENTLLTKLIESGEGYREKVKGEIKREVWGYFLKEDGE